MMLHVSDRITHAFAAFGVLAILVGLSAAAFYTTQLLRPMVRSGAALITGAPPEHGAPPNSWAYTFNSDGVLHEAPSPEASSSPFWWLNSGGTLAIENGVGHTNLGAATPKSEWYWRYRLGNSLDTDGGRYPQNLFRLISKQAFGDGDISMLFRVRAVHLTDTPNRDGYSGVFLMGRYYDGDNLYYAGVRQDGHVVIKKKIGGVYHTLAEEPYFESLRPYDKNTNPNFIPGNVWIGMRMRIETEEDAVRVTLFLDEEGEGAWEEALSATDDGTDGAPHRDAGRMGIRTDYLDAEFDNVAFATSTPNG